MVDALVTLALPLAGGGGIGFMVGYALKKVIKIAMVIMGAFFGAVIYFQSQGIMFINWEKVYSMANGTMNTLVNSTGADQGIIQTVITNLGIPLAGGMAAGFALGFMKG